MWLGLYNTCLLIGVLLGWDAVLSLKLALDTTRSMSSIVFTRDWTLTWNGTTTRVSESSPWIFFFSKEIYKAWFVLGVPSFLLCVNSQVRRRRCSQRLRRDYVAPFVRHGSRPHAGVRLHVLLHEPENDSGTVLKHWEATCSHFNCLFFSYWNVQYRCLFDCPLPSLHHFSNDYNSNIIHAIKW